MVGKVRDRAVRVSVLLGICLALVVSGALVWGELRAVASNRADGDPGQGSYLQDPERADRTAGDVLDGIVAEGEDPPADATAFAGTESGSGASGAPDPVRWADGGWRPSSPLRARTAPSEPAIGALFSPGNDWDADHHCSASVVHSPEGDLIATAAHCVYQDGFRTNLAFVPGYRDGKAPFGVWVPTRIDVDPRWTGDEDPDHDVAFLRLRYRAPG